MGKYTIKSKDLTKIGYNNDVARSVAMSLTSKHFKHSPKDEVLRLLVELKDNPDNFLQHEALAPLANKLLCKTGGVKFTSHELRIGTRDFQIYGGKDIDGVAKRQIELAMSLPIAVRGALMADAHVGFGLPVGGVLATDNAVIPFAVGVDIGCRMALSIFEMPEKYLQMNAYAMKKALAQYTHFGMEGSLEFSQAHEVLDREEFAATDLLRKLHGTAARQLGSSGGGNHFVEFGLIDLFENNVLGMAPGKYVSLLTHSGSRGMGAAIAKHYTNIAMETCKLPREAKQLAWLSLDSEAGQEYWMSMNLAGDYARACHDVIHHNLSKAIGEKAATKVENHHNFAWRDKLSNGQEVIIHRKGATPAHDGELGIIPGSMTTGCYLVSGKGVEQSLYSSSHGAGRRLSRGKAKETFTGSAMKKLLSEAAVTLIGGSTEECPLAYKDIEKVMQAQKSLIDVQGKFMPKIVRMNKE
ncbi:MAG TPA: RtcB family protein [Cytophagaceae bacterium]|jgi:tRNA-splicing ligase RtcB